MSFKNIVTEGKLVDESKLDGTFKGFNAHTLFPLTNGKYWLQTSIKYWNTEAFNPSIKIYYYQNQHYLIKDGSENFVEVSTIDDVVKSTFKNDFNGWEGQTVFKLDNGEVWEQDEYESYSNNSYQHEALIYNSGLDYRLQVDGNSIAVKKVN
jgi:hypothetical protein